MTVNAHRQLAALIRERARLTGNFRLRSGTISNIYWDKYRFESDPVLLAPLAGLMQALLPSSFDCLAAMQLGGIPLGTALSLRTNKRCLYIRKEAKEYGTAQQIEGGFSPGEEVVLIEDVITTAGAVCDALRVVRSAGLNAHHVICVIDRQEGGQQALADLGCTLSSAFTMRELEA